MHIKYPWKDRQEAVCSDAVSERDGAAGAENGGALPSLFKLSNFESCECIVYLSKIKINNSNRN